MNVVFDIGNVLIRWRPERAVAEYFPDPAEARAYFDRVGFAAWNLANDAGRSFAEGLAALEAAHPGEAAPLAAYRARFALTIEEPIAGTWALVDRLLARQVPLYAITNFAAETWPEALRLHPRLGGVFRDTIVSGQVRLIKPGPAIYQLLLARADLDPARCLFIDDSPANVDGARAVGMQAHHFTGPEALEADLVARGLA